MPPHWRSHAPLASRESHVNLPISETQRIGNSHLRKVSVSESNVLLDEEVLTDPKIQALLLTVLVRGHRGRPPGSAPLRLLTFVVCL